MAQLKLFAFGPPRLERAGRPVEISLRKAVALFVYLAVTQRSHSRDALATLLWPDSDQRFARASLRRTLYRLNQALGKDVLVVTRESVALNPKADVWLDIEAYQRHVVACLHDGLSIDDLSPDCLSCLTDAVELYTDDFLAGFTLSDCPDFDEWQFFRMESLRQSLAQGLEQLTHVHQAQNEYEPAIAYARRRLSLDPLHEPSHRHLMRLYALANQQAAALRQYEACAHILDEEFGVAPEEETTALYEAIKTKRLQPSRRAERPVGRGGASPTVPHLRTSASPPVALRSPPHNLPAQSTPFVGRENELASVVRRLVDPACRLLTLIGPGGIGKTRLAIQAVQRFADDPDAVGFADGVFYVPLESISSPSGIVSAIADAVGFDFYVSAPPKQQLLDYLRTKQMLLVLDNFEHLLDSAGLISEALAAAPALKVLVTSREALNLHEAWFHPVAGMRFPRDVVGYSVPVEKYDAVRLFEQSARRAQVEFSLAAEQEAVVRICRLVEGMPLAIELAAAWLKVLPAAQIAREIERGLDILTARFRNVPERHRSMRAVMEQAWALLSDEERDVLKRLSVFRRGFEQDAAEAVADASLLTLATLVEKALLRVTDAGRYRMHELIRQYADEKLAEDSPIALATQERHSAYYLDFLKTRAKMLTGPAQRTAVVEISREIDNVRPAWVWAVQQNNLAAIHQTLHGYFNFHLVRSRFQDGEDGLGYLLDHLQQTAELFEHPESKSIQARALARCAAFCYSLGKYDSAKQHAEEGLAIGLEVGCHSDVAFAQIVMGVVAGWQGKKKEAEEWLYQSLSISREIDDKENMADALHELAQIRTSFGDYAAAKQLAEESLAVSRTYGRPDWIAQALVILGWAIVSLGDYAEAEACYQEALATFESLGNRHGAADALDGLGWVAWCQGGENLEKAGQYYEQSVDMMAEIGHRRLMANTLCDLAILANEREDFARAEAISREGFRLAEELDSSVYRVPYLCCLGGAASGRGDYAASRSYLRQALQLAYDTQLLPPLTWILFEFAILLVRESDADGVSYQSSLQKKSQALELLTVVIRHPATWQGMRDRAARLRVRLEAELPADVVRDTRETVQQATLETLVVSILEN